MAFVAINTSQVDADSPLDATLMTQVKDNFDALNGADVTGGDAHDHSGGDGAVIPQGGLKSTVGIVNTNNPTVGLNLTLPGGEYGFYPRISSDFGVGATAAIGGTGSSSLVTNVWLRSSSAAGNANAQQRYIQASPPYMIGNKKWGHFLFTLTDASGSVQASYEAADPPWAYNGKTWLPKDHSSRIRTVPHPFADYHKKDPAVDGLQINLIDLSNMDVRDWKMKNPTGKLHKHITSDGSSLSHSELGLEAISGFTDKVKIRQAVLNKPKGGAK